MRHLFQNKNHFQVILLAVFIVVLTIACVKKDGVFASNYTVNSPVRQTETPRSEQIKTTDKIDESEKQTNSLKELLAAANSQAVAEAKRQGETALPLIRSFLEDANYRVRQIAVSCAGAIGDPQGADILAAGLKDANINVRLAAARELSKKPYPAAMETVLEVLKNSTEGVIRELLVTAAGFLPDEKTVAALRPLTNGDSSLAEKAVAALAKLGDAAGRKSFSAKLSAKLPRTRYEALEALCYVNDSVFAAPAEKLLSDNANALPIGQVRSRKYRRVADQAVDSLVCLLKLQPPFETSPEKIYTIPEIATIRNLVK